MHESILPGMEVKLISSTAHQVSFITPLASCPGCYCWKQYIQVITQPRHASGEHSYHTPADGAKVHYSLLWWQGALHIIMMPRCTTHYCDDKVHFTLWCQGALHIIVMTRCTSHYCDNKVHFTLLRRQGTLHIIVMTNCTTHYIDDK